MRSSVRDFVQIVADTIPIICPIYEFGSLQVPGQEGFADLRPLFNGKEYVGCDMREGTGVDKILNLHNIDLPSESVGTVLCMDTLEHVEYPYIALKEIHRILCSNGIVVISSVMKFVIHDFPYDYWRFTPEAIKSLLKPFEHMFVGYAGDINFPHTVVGIGFKGQLPNLSAFNEQYKEWQKKSNIDMEEIAPEKSSTTPKGVVTNLRELTKLFIPPILLLAKRRIAGKIDEIQKFQQNK